MKGKHRFEGAFCGLDAAALRGPWRRNCRWRASRDPPYCHERTTHVGGEGQSSLCQKPMYRPPPSSLRRRPLQVVMAQAFAANSVDKVRARRPRSAGSDSHAGPRRLITPSAFSSSRIINPLPLSRPCRIWRWPSSRRRASPKTRCPRRSTSNVRGARARAAWGVCGHVSSPSVFFYLVPAVGDRGGGITVWLFSRLPLQLTLLTFASPPTPSPRAPLGRGPADLISAASAEQEPRVAAAVRGLLACLASPLLLIPPP